MKNLIYAAVLFIFITPIKSQLAYKWAKQLGGSNKEYARAVTTDVNGNVYTTGDFEGTVDLDPGPGTFTMSSIGQSDIFVSKLDLNGNFVWAIRIGGPDKSEAHGIAVDASGNICITGHVDGQVDFDPGPSVSSYTATFYDGYVCKLSPSGNLIWYGAFPGSGFSEGNGIVIDNAGNIYTAGSYNSQVDMDPGPGTTFLTAWSAAYVNKLDINGNLLWARHFPTTNTLSGSIDGAAISLDPTGNPHITGSFNSAADFDPGPSTFTLSAGGSFYDPYVVKLNASGSLVWARQFRSTANSSGQTRGLGIKVDVSGNVFSCGWSQDSADYDPGAGVNYLFNVMYLSKLNSSGLFVWAKGFGSNSGYFRSVDTDAFGNVYVAGQFWGNIDFDPGAGTYNLSSVTGWGDVFLGKYGSSGNLLWAGAIGGIQDDNANDVYIDGGNNVYLAGSFEFTPDFDPGSGSVSLTSAGMPDAFVEKFCATPATPLAINGPTVVCDGSTINYSIATVSGATSYSWNIPGSWTGTSTTTLINTTAIGIGGNITITANNTCGESWPQTLNVIVNPLPTISLTAQSYTQCVSMSTNSLNGSPTTGTYSGNGVSGTNFNAGVAGAGTHTLVYTHSDSNGCTNSDSITVMVSLCTELNEFSLENNLNVYPNPFETAFTVKINGEADLTILNTFGQVVKYIRLNEGINKIDLAGEEQGIYFLSIEAGHERAVRKVIRN